MHVQVFIGWFVSVKECQLLFDYAMLKSVFYVFASNYMVSSKLKFIDNLKLFLIQI